ncbi:Crp/Fnr family transcriptional regulator [Xaviernesmea oryzae]|uniref:Crp/Fnr family transcriptional regulator n=1 Tax=Xaviernesmea oryzae TaxID=464029 RepID=A0A1Q9B132_9HYPH|nr:Crp/Fnr family transcriptional regulator [Xaviernesmea oryzae]OLP61677.1 Crp/Fnr family transcriptional regulator [Xaviernesmea oryzae]SEL03197.1 cAMP-binding domain of CRP or a regulatory subunit of cAMP-dependent protein kinases [Xaviernesmea oryzae]
MTLSAPPSRFADPQASSVNRLLASLPDEEQAFLAPHLEAIDLPRGFSIVEAGNIIEHVYFLEDGIGSVIAVSPRGRKAEAGMFGREGFTPTPPLAGVDTSLHQVIIQIAGHGHRMPLAAFRQASTCCPHLHERLVRAAHHLAMQVSFTALSNASAPVEERLARWVLMCHDRLSGDEMRITHDFISLMLAVRRPSVTTALHMLEGRGWIRAERGVIFMRDRAALEEFASDIYGAAEAEYHALLGPF